MISWESKMKIRNAFPSMALPHEQSTYFVKYMVNIWKIIVHKGCSNHSGNIRDRVRSAHLAETYWFAWFTLQPTEAINGRWLHYSYLIVLLRLIIMFSYFSQTHISIILFWFQFFMTVLLIMIMIYLTESFFVLSPPLMKHVLFILRKDRTYCKTCYKPNWQPFKNA